MYLGEDFPAGQTIERGIRSVAYQHLHDEELTIHDQTQPVEDQCERDGPLHGRGTAGDSIASRRVRVTRTDSVKDTERDRYSTQIQHVRKQLAS